MATPITPDIQANFESCRAPSQSNTLNNPQILMDADFCNAYQ